MSLIISQQEIRFYSADEFCVLFRIRIRCILDEKRQYKLRSNVIISTIDLAKKEITLTKS